MAVTQSIHGYCSCAPRANEGAVSPENSPALDSAAAAAAAAAACCGVGIKKKGATRTSPRQAERAQARTGTGGADFGGTTRRL